MISVTIVTKNFRFLYTINENLANIEAVKTSHILPEEQVPENTQVIITTEAEKRYTNSKRFFIPKSFNQYYLYSNIYLHAKNKTKFDEIIVGIDPGKCTGLAIVTKEGIILGTGEYYTAVDTVKEVISSFLNIETTRFTVKIGAGGGEIRDEIVKRLKGIFHDEKASIKIVSEDFTSKVQKKPELAKYSKNIKSAILIASRTK